MTVQPTDAEMGEPNPPLTAPSEDALGNHLDPLQAESRSIQAAVQVGSEKDALDDGRTSSEVPIDDATKVPQTASTAHDWDGPNDPANPMNWPAWKKIYHTAATASMGFAVTSGSSLITPAAADIQQYFHVSLTAAILSLSLFALGLGLGPVIAAPISENWGRSVVYKTTVVIYMLFIMGAGFSTSFGSLLVCRCLAGIAGGPCLAVGAGTNADMYDVKGRAIAASFFIMMPFLGPAISPVIGGFVAEYKGWQWTQWCTIFVAIVASVPVAFMSETYKKVLLRRRAKKLGIPGPPESPIKGLQYAKLLLTITLLRPVRMLFTEPIVFLFSLYNAFGFSILFAFFAIYPYVFRSVYGLNTWQCGLIFLGIGVGVICGVITCITVDRLYYLPHFQQAVEKGQRQLAPEYRLLAGQLGSVGIPIGLFWFAWSARHDVHWIVPTLAGIPFAWGNLCVFISGALYLIDVYGPLNGASALAANGLARYSMAAGFPLFAVQMYQRLGVGWATSLLGFISVAMMPIPFLFFQYGPKIRSKSRFDTVKF